MRGQLSRTVPRRVATGNSRCLSAPYKKAIEALNVLKAELPLCFKHGKEKLPIAVGIHHDVLSHYANDKRFSKTNLRKAINLYTSGTVYLGKITVGIPRIDLLGKETTRVTKEEAQNARALLLEKRERMLQKLFRQKKNSKLTRA